MKVVTYKNNGKTFYSIVNDSFIPVHYLVSYFLQVELGNRQSNTKERRAYELLFAFKYFDKRDIDFISNIAKFKFIDPDEISMFAASCKLKAEVVKERIVTTIVTENALRNLIARNQPVENIVEEGTAKGRLETFIRFYRFVFNRTHGRSVVSEEQQKKYNQCLIDLSTSINSMGKWSTHVSDPFKSKFPDEKYFELLELIKPSNEANPFSSKIRNALITKLFIETGIRRGAVAKLKISDVFNDKEPRVRVTRTPDDVTDPRRNKAAQKTKSHVSPISPDLAKGIEYYIINIRNSLPNAHTHEFIFVTEKNCRGTLGMPLTLQSINGIFLKLSKILDVNITPHTLRHKWNEIFDEGADSLAKELNLDTQAKEDIRRYAMGWSAKSTMADVYNNFRMAVKTRDYHLARQREFSESLKNKVN
jgi:integrase